jgi:hypothetical protein
MEAISTEIFKVLGYLFIAYIVYAAWLMARKNAGGGNFKMVLWKGFLWCAGIALFASFSLGNPTCDVQSDPLYGGCDEYADNGFEPTTEQRTSKFAYWLTLLYLPVIFGAYMGRNEPKDAPVD